MQAMLERDFLWCGLQMLLDEEEEFARLCPSCQVHGMEDRCVACGALVGEASACINENFDLDLFYSRIQGTEKAGG